MSPVSKTVMQIVKGDIFHLVKGNGVFPILKLPLQLVLGTEFPLCL